MLLKALTLENFKGIREPVRVEFAPLTLLFGPNNAGKSTIMQALMYAREVLERNNCDAGRTVLGGNIVDLGGFRNMVHDQDIDRAIRMRFELDLRTHGLPYHMTEEQAADLYRREEELELVESSRMGDSLGLDTSLLHWARSELTDVWVEFEIAHRQLPLGHQGVNPVVRRYSVGTGSTLYATISLPEDSVRAALTYCNFGVPPFGWTYTKGDSTDFDWDFGRLTRRWIQREMSTKDNLSRGLKKGAKVAFAGEPSGPNTNMVSRDAFDTLVAEIVAGEGKWGDDTIDATTGEFTWAYRQRQALINLAHSAGRIRADEERWQESVDARLIVPLSEEELIELLSEDPARTHEEARHIEEERRIRFELLRLLEESELTASDEWYGWLFEWVKQLTKPLEWVAPEISKWGPDDPVELTIKDTAMPGWREGIQPYTDIWLSEKEKGVEGIASWLSLGQEYLIDFLSAVIVGPGQLLLAALQGSTYLGPFRKLPTRHYRPTTGPEQESWANGLAAWNLLMTENKQKLIDAVNDWLCSSERFGTGYRIEIQRHKRLDIRSPLWGKLMTGNLADQAEAIRQELDKLPEETVKLEFVNEVSGLALAPQDLGVGISQVLPVIVAALHNNPGVVAIEEPESNIHPAFQVVLGDLFLSQANANREAIFLVETHSEHLMLRCLRRIRETGEGEIENGVPDLRPEDIAVHFVEASDGGPRIHRIRIDKDGEFLDPWPRGFFPERIKELYGDDL